MLPNKQENAQVCRSRNLDELDIDTESKNEEELKEIIRHIQVIIYNDHSVSIGDNNKIKDSTISSAINE